MTLSVLPGFGTRNAGSGEGLGSASLALGVVPADVGCVRIAVAGDQTVVRSFDIDASSQALLSLGGLPLANGRANVTGEFSADGGDSGSGVPNMKECDSSGCVCLPGFADCNGTLVDGCETDTTSDRANCGGCGIACALGSTCVRGVCGSGSDGGPAGGGGSDAAEASAPDAAAGPICASGAALVVADGGTFVPLDGSLRQILVDPCNAHVYVSNQSNNQIENYSIAANALEPAIAVGSEPNGFDITPDGARLYVANTGATNLSVVDLTTRTEIRKIKTPSGFSNDTPLSLAIASNGKALFSTTFAGSGFGAQMLSLDLATETIALQTDFFLWRHDHRSYGPQGERRSLRYRRGGWRHLLGAGLPVSSGDGQLQPAA